MTKRDVIAALAALADDEQIRVKVGDDYYLAVAVTIEPFATQTSPTGATWLLNQGVNQGVIHIHQE